MQAPRRPKNRGGVRLDRIGPRELAKGTFPHAAVIGTLASADLIAVIFYPLGGYPGKPG